MLFRYCVVASLVFTLVGCAGLKPNYIKKRETEYLCASEAPPLQLPPGCSTTNIGCDYIIPPVATPCTRTPVDITPPDLYPAR